MRTLASIQTITEIHPIPDADSIEVAKVLGWHVVIKKDEFKVGDKVVYIEVDALLPKDNPAFDFIHQKSNGRIRTTRLRGQISQGICFPLTILPGWGNTNRNQNDIETGYDVSQILNITKYEAPIPACIAGVAKGKFPGFIPQTDETRVQILQDTLDRHKGTECIITEKIDGTSFTAYKRDEEFGVCSRTLELKENENNTLWQMARKYNLENILKEEDLDLAIQGEVIGDGIQGNKYKLPKNERRLYIFNIFNINSYQYWNHNDVQKFCQKHNLLTVPQLNTITLNNNIDELIELSKGQSQLNPNTKREGIVIRPLNETTDRLTGRLSFKAINPEFLLKHKDD